MREPTAEQVIKATELFHKALDTHVPYSIHDAGGDWVDGGASEVVLALLKDGWRPCLGCQTDEGTYLPECPVHGVNLELARLDSEVFRLQRENNELKAKVSREP